MGNSFEINIDWHDRKDDPIHVNNFTACYMTIKLYDKYITNNIDQFDNQCKDHIVTSAYPFAEWLAFNYFRLLWEEKDNTHDYAMSHCMASIGYGFLWPNCTFVKDDNYIHAVMHKSDSIFTYDPKTNVSIMILTKEDFIETIENFIEKTISKLLEFNVDPNNSLISLWNHIKEDKKNPQQMLYNIFEAKLGYDYTQGNRNHIIGNDLYKELIVHYNNNNPPYEEILLNNKVTNDDFIITEQNIKEEANEQILTAIINKSQEIDDTIGIVYPEMENMPDAKVKVKKLIEDYASNFKYTLANDRIIKYVEKHTKE